MSQHVLCDDYLHTEMWGRICAEGCAWLVFNNSVECCISSYSQHPTGGSFIHVSSIISKILSSKGRRLRLLLSISPNCV